MADDPKKDPPKADPPKADDDDAALMGKVKGIFKEALTEWQAEREANAPPPEPKSGLARILGL